MFSVLRTLCRCDCTSLFLKQFYNIIINVIIIVSLKKKNRWRFDIDSVCLFSIVLEIGYSDIDFKDIPKKLFEDVLDNILEKSDNFYLLNIFSWQVERE